MLPSGSPNSTTWEPMVLVGLSSSGFMSTCGVSPAAAAWAAWARPISPHPPLAVRAGAALLLMFCALNGATE